MLPFVRDLEVVTLPRKEDARGALTVIEALNMPPFPVRRLFWIDHVPAGAVRGAHGHKTCQQFFVCLSGLVRIEANDGESAPRTLILKQGQTLFMPAAIYATQTYEGDGAVLLVLCDQPYADEDYLRSIEALKAHRLAVAGE